MCLNKKAPHKIKENFYGLMIYKQHDFYLNNRFVCLFTYRKLKFQLMDYFMHTRSINPKIVF